ncbi:heavy metal-associated isoprenylated plant protein 7-like isoform X2 [Asparagus officinalis]|uniref:heavy metal-associated isoprenylated plant protein 7-like isoform X2 n=1 Tax=Asparagus officinalis TaxID=4686 RepID=UPI00098E09B7|nr:heavy metal-associated isoprenylated plant protein 7-like isoform X2 [Asparagus officinalis]
MGEEVKKPEEEKKAEDEKPKAEDPTPKPEDEPKKEGGEEKPSGDAPPAEETPSPPPPPPEEIEMRVFMHCEGCARKVKRSLKGFEGVEDVRTDCKTHKVVVKGKKAAEDPLKVVDRVQKKTGRKVQLLTPLPPPKEEKKEEEKEEEKPKVEEKKEPVVIAVVLKVHMHCEACAQEIKKRILKMKGVQSAEPELKASQVTVKGIFDPPKLVEYMYKRTGKHAIIVKTEPEKKPDEEKPKDDEKPKEDKKTEEKPEGEKTEKEAVEKKDAVAGDEAAASAPVVTGPGGAVKVEQKRNEFYYYYPRYQPMEYAYPPQMFSDENPNACSVM